MTQKHIYLDYGAATPMSENVLAAMQPYFSQYFQNASGLTLASINIRLALDEARARVATCLGARPQEIIFTAGGSESTNLAIQGVMQRYTGKKILVSAVEHPAVLKPAQRYSHKILPVDGTGRLDIAKLTKSVDDETVLISVMLVNNEIGTLQPLREVVRLVQEVREQRKIEGNSLPLYVHTDACQAPMYLDVHVGRLGVDLLTLNGGKMYGPKQSGILYVKTGVQLQPQILGGGQEFGKRSGTENVAAAVGFAAALATAQANRKQESMRQAALRDALMVGLAKLPGVTLNGDLHERIANNVHVTIADTDNERILMMLDEQGIECAVGSACSASSDEPSHVLKAIGLTDEEARSSLRFTLGVPTTSDDIATVLKALQTIIH